MYASPEDQLIFGPARNKIPRLKSYGVAQHIPCIKAEICLSKQARAGLHEALAETSGHLTRNKTQQMKQGNFQVQLRRMGKRGPPPWKHICDKLTVLPIEELVSKHLEADTFGPASREPLPFSFLLTCSTCCNQVESSKKDLIKNSRWGNIYCRTCMATRKASKWECACGKYWHQCQIHRKIGLACQKAAKPRMFSQIQRRNQCLPLGSIDTTRLRGLRGNKKGYAPLKPLFFLVSPESSALSLKKYRTRDFPTRSLRFPASP